MSKRVSLNDDELYIIRQALQDIDNHNLLSDYWAEKYISRRFLTDLLEKLSSDKSSNLKKGTDI